MVKLSHCDVKFHDDIKAWNHMVIGGFPSQRMCSFDAFYVVSLNKLLQKTSDLPVIRDANCQTNGFA